MNHVVPGHRGRCLLAAIAVLASDWSAAGDGDTLPEVIVTARRVAEDSRTLPLAVDVVGAGQLGAGGIVGMPDLATHLPGMNFESFWGGSGASPVLRGQAQPSTAADNVGVFVDDIYQAGRSAMDIDPLDIERIEVLRGPQNTQFGRSTFAGAIRYVTHRPTTNVQQELRVEAGSDGLFGASGALSGPLAAGWLGRLAFGHREAGGTLEVDGVSDAGDMRSNSFVLGIDLEAEGGERLVQLTARAGDARFGQPPASPVGAVAYNCGAANAASGIWSYFCGDLPIAGHLSLTPQLPESHSRYTQVAAQLNLPVGAFMLRSLSGGYYSSSTSFRDFDGSSLGFPSGVCRVGVTCPAPGSFALVDRFVSPNVVTRGQVDTRELSQEFRLEGAWGSILQWMLGASGWWTRQHDWGSMGVDRGDLSSSERLTSLSISNLSQVGQISPLNNALVADSRQQQLLQNEVASDLSGYSAFGMLDWSWTARSRLRLELRGNWEHQERDSRVASSRPDTTPDPPPIDFATITPRLSIDYRWQGWYSYVSLARGARAGGMNTNPGISVEEQEYGPEYNWTSELGLRYLGSGLIQGWQATLYYVDWSDTQILGLSTTPGVNTFVIGNTAGLYTRGLETQVDLRLSSWLGVRLIWSQADPRFRAGSDDVGSRTFCGLTTQPPRSNFCAYGPPRSENGSNIPQVPYVDGNAPARASRSSGWAVLNLASPEEWVGWRLSALADLAYQGDVYERTINGARYGERTLLGLRLAAQKGPWRIAAWATNLADDRYVRSSASRGGNYYPSMPRPLDLLYGEGRRIGLTVAYSSAAP